MEEFEQMFQMDFLKTFEVTVAVLTKDQLLKIMNNHCMLTPKGMAYHDSVTAMFTSQDV